MTFEFTSQISLRIFPKVLWSMDCKQKHQIVQTISVITVPENVGTCFTCFNFSSPISSDILVPACNQILLIMNVTVGIENFMKNNQDDDILLQLGGTRNLHENYVKQPAREAPQMSRPLLEKILCSYIKEFLACTNKVVTINT